MEEDVRMLALRAFPHDYSGSKQKTPVSEHHWKQLGFLKGDPQDDFNECPPGVLALDCMVYFAKNKTDAFTRLLFSYTAANISLHTLVSLTKVLCQMLRNGFRESDGGCDQEDNHCPCQSSYLTSSKIFRNKFYDLNYKKLKRAVNIKMRMSSSLSLSRSSVRRSNQTLSIFQ